MNDTHHYLVREKKQENYDTVTISLTCENGTVPPFVSGQFISVYFPELSTPEGKSYSISNPPGEMTFNITVKGIGEFSNRLCSLKPGDKVLGSLPYGYFYSEQDDLDLVMIAGGIGITPFRSAILHTLTHNPDRKITLFQSAKTAADLVFEDELSSLSRVETHYFLTKDLASHRNATPRRIQSGDIITNCRPEHAEFFICGSIPFVRDIWRGLKDHGIAEDRICTEAFFSH